jgi:hypothetical protein
MSNEYKYEFGGKTWIQKPLVLAQYDQLSKIVLTLPMPKEFDVPGVIAAFGPHIHKALAIALTPEGMHPKDKDLEATAEEIEWSIDLPTIQAAVTDFFVLSPLRSLFADLTKMLEGVRAMIDEAQRLETASRN